METWSAHHLYNEAVQILGSETASQLQQYAQGLKSKRLPVIFSLHHLSEICKVPYWFLRDTVNRERESSNYRIYSIGKRSGGRRLIHAVGSDLLRVQSFINDLILQKCQPHPASFAFHSSGGIQKCAAEHCGARFLFQFDLTDFFYDVTEIEVYRIFDDFGYRRLLSFEFARLCTTTRIPNSWARYLRKYPYGLRFDPERVRWFPYDRTVERIAALPQGAPSSPMLANLAAFSLDESLSEYASENGFVYTRYADDITFSATNLPKARGRVRNDIIHRIRNAGFKENPKKSRIAGPGSKKVVLGLLVDGAEPRLSRETYKRIDRLLYGAKKFGLAAAAEHFGFESTYGFYNHISGLIAFVKDVDQKRWEVFSERWMSIKQSQEST